MTETSKVQQSVVRILSIAAVLLAFVVLAQAIPVKAHAQSRVDARGGSAVVVNSGNFTVGNDSGVTSDNSNKDKKDKDDKNNNGNGNDNEGHGYGNGNHFPKLPNVNGQAIVDYVFGFFKGFGGFHF